MAITKNSESKSNKHDQKIWIVVAAGEKAREHLKRTIENPVLFDELEERFKDNTDLLRSLKDICNELGTRCLYLWGAKPGKANEENWRKMTKNDICIFYTGNKYSYWCKILKKIQNKDIAEYLWGRDNNGTWELIYFLSKPIKIELTREKFNKDHGYDKKYVPQGLTRISDKVVKNIRSRYGTYENYLRRFEIGDSYYSFLRQLYSEELNIAFEEMQVGQNIIFYGPPGSGKTVLSKILAEMYSKEFSGNGYVLYTVHSGTDYYDLVSRIIPETINGNLVYKKESRFLLDAILSKKVLILDEINRTQIDTALGIFFTYLEYHHRIKDSKILRDIISKELGINIDESDFLEKLRFFRIIATLNIYDKTFLYKLGDALKRRFRFIRITTSKHIIEHLDKNFEYFLNVIDIPSQGQIRTIIDDAYSLFKEINRIKELGIGILKDFLQFIYRQFCKCKNNILIGKKEVIENALIIVILPYFENDINYIKLKNLLSSRGYNEAVRVLEELNFARELPE